MMLQAIQLVCVHLYVFVCMHVSVCLHTRLHTNGTDIPHGSLLGAICGTDGHFHDTDCSEHLYANPASPKLV